MKKWLMFAVAEIAKIHDYFLTLNDGFPTVLSDKQLHFLVVGLMGMILFFVVHPLFKALAKKGHIIAVSWFYVFTLILGMTFAVEIGQQVTHSGTMEFADIVFGVAGFLTMFGIFALIRMFVMLVVWLINKNKKDRGR